MHYELDHHPKLVETDQSLPHQRQVGQKRCISLRYSNCKNTVEYVGDSAQKNEGIKHEQWMIPYIFFIANCIYCLHRCKDELAEVYQGKDKNANIGCNHQVGACDVC